jgi:membrane protein
MVSIQKFLQLRQVSFGQLISSALEKIINEHEIITRASAIAFDGLLAFIPVVTLFATVAAKLLPSLADPSRQDGLVNAQEVLHFLQSVFPPAVAKIIQDQIVAMQSVPSFEVLGVVTVLAFYLGSGFFAEVINAVNHIYGLSDKRSVWQVRLVSLKLIAANTATMLVSLVMITAGPWIFQWLGSSEWLGATINTAAVFLMILLGFGLTFKLAPSAPQKFTLISPGAFVGSVLFMVASFCFRFWVTHVAHYQLLYGALGSIMMLFVWSFLMSVVFLMATEMNKLAKFAAEVADAEKPKGDA